MNHFFPFPTSHTTHFPQILNLSYWYVQKSFNLFFCFIITFKTRFKLCLLVTIQTWDVGGRGAALQAQGGRGGGSFTFKLKMETSQPSSETPPR